MPTPTLTDIEEDEDFTGLPAPEQEKVRMRYLKEAVLPDPDFQALPPPEKQKVSTRVMQTAVPESVWQAFRFMPQPGGPTAQPSLAGVPGIAGTEFAPTQPITPRPAPRRAPAALPASPTMMPDRIMAGPSPPPPGRTAQTLEDVTRAAGGVTPEAIAAAGQAAKITPMDEVVTAPARQLLTPPEAWQFRPDMPASERAGRIVAGDVEKVGELIFYPINQIMAALEATGYPKDRFLGGVMPGLRDINDLIMGGFLGMHASGARLPFESQRAMARELRDTIDESLYRIRQEVENLPEQQRAKAQAAVEKNAAQLADTLNKQAADHYIIQSEDGRVGRLGITPQGNPVWQEVTNARKVRSALEPKQGRYIFSERVPPDEFDAFLPRNKEGYPPGAVEEAQQRFLTDEKIPLQRPRSAPGKVVAPVSPEPGVSPPPPEGGIPAPGQMPEPPPAPPAAPPVAPQPPGEPPTPSPAPEVPPAGQPAPGAVPPAPPPAGTPVLDEPTYQKVRSFVEGGGRVSIPTFRMNRDLKLTTDQAQAAFERLKQEGVIEQTPEGWRGIKKAVILPENLQTFLGTLRDGGVDEGTVGELERVLKMGTEQKAIDDIEAHFARGMDEREIYTRLPKVPPDDRATLVRAVQEALGIPNREEEPDAFEQWVMDYRRRQTAVPGTPEGDAYAKAVEHVKSGGPITATAIGKQLGAATDTEAFRRGSPLLNTLEANGIIELAPGGGWQLRGALPPSEAPAAPPPPAVGAPEVPPPTPGAPATPPQQGVPFVLTREQRQSLLDLGWTNEQVNSFTPARAQELLQANMGPTGRQAGVPAGAALPVAQIPPTQLGRTTETETANMKTDLQFAVLEADQPIVSHTPEGQENPQYPAGYQQRLRDTVAYRMSTYDRANKLKPVWRVLHQLRAIGVRIALDDFGTGYSSLSYLKRFPFDKIKIDRCFVSDIAEIGGSSVIVQAVVNIAAARNMTTTAEGVETAEQREMLRALGCTEMQGYLFSAAKPGPEVRRLFGRARGDDVGGRLISIAFSSEAGYPVRP